MFELVEKLTTSTNSNKQSSLASALFYQSKQGLNFVQEAFRFEGLPLTVVKPYSEEAVLKSKSEHELGLLMFDFTQANNIHQEALKLSSIIPTSARVVIIGTENTITIIRQLRELGFYYVLWPVAADEFISFLSNANSTTGKKEVGLPQRQAKRIRVIGSKGGVGATLIASELSKVLSHQNLSQCVLVDHNYWGGNLDIMMGLADFQKRDISVSTFGTGIDQTSAHSMLKQAKSSLSLLSLTSKSKALTELSDYTKTVADHLAFEANFIIEDFPMSVAFHNPNLSDATDTVIMIVSPTVSSLRDAGLLKQTITESASGTPPRIILVVNYVMPSKYATVTLEEVKAHLNQDIDIVLPHLKQINQLIIHNNNKKLLSSSFGRGLQQLSAKILGRSNKKTRFSLFSRGN